MSKQERDRRHDAKRKGTAHEWYGLAIWQKIRARQLAIQPLCERHLKRGEIVGANTVNHAEPHKGDWSKFLSGPFESLCPPCHNADAQGEERRGYSNDVDPTTGYPRDPRHPFNR